MSNPNIQKHPSYGLLRFSRISSGKPVQLYGSSIEHQETIRMSVSPSYIERDLSTDWYHKSGRELIEVEMSYAQFAEVISSMNMGNGVPVTIKHINQETIPSPTIDNKRLQFESEIENKLNDINQKLESLVVESKDLLENKKSINKGDRQIILNQLDGLFREVKSNIPFVYKMFNEQMDKTVHQAKSEVEAFTQSKILQMGLDQIEKSKSIPNPVNPSDYIDNS